MIVAARSAAASARPHVQGLLRIVTGLLFACHGAASVLGVFGGAHGTTLPVGQWPGWWAALIQLVGGALVLLGLGTRSAALLCSGSMAYAYFTVHQEHALWPIQNGGELSVLFCWIFLSIAVTGPGSLALDGLLPGARTPKKTTAPTASTPHRAPAGRA
ncbi:putative oxidoreductase [Kitasatospora sp. MAA4]|uniref:DoxX family protein n=1 Tax=Kitasatospora sp. MAA4 TaxID=3035093 RepID=UPI002475D5A2|nr:DoxX family protein [Kitasatospora sp. MAA4]MDH6135554.1 putative oxidoreductase [Kitasatospora sp. MAA4]